MLLPCHTLSLALNALGVFCSLIICATLFARPRSIYHTHKPNHLSTPRVFFVCPSVPHSQPHALLFFVRAIRAVYPPYFLRLLPRAKCTWCVLFAHYLRHAFCAPAVRLATRPALNLPARHTLSYAFFAPALNLPNPQAKPPKPATLFTRPPSALPHATR